MNTQEILAPKWAADYTPSRWQKLTLGGVLLRELRKILLIGSTDDLQELRHKLQQWRKRYVEDALRPYVKKQYDIALQLWEMANECFSVKRTLDSQHTSYATGWQSAVWYYLTKGQSRGAKDERIIRVLWVDKTHNKGCSGRLKVALLGQGRGQIFCSCANIFLVRDSKFDQAMANTREFLQQQGIWPEQEDIRWELEADNKDEPIPEMSGGSMGGAFAIALWSLLSKDPQLDLNGVACTAEIDCHGNLQAIGHFWTKLAPCSDLAKRGLLRLLLIAEIQVDQFCEDITLYQVGEAQDVPGALELIREHQRPRRNFLHQVKHQTARLTLFDRYSVSFDHYYQELPLWRKADTGKEVNAILQWEEQRGLRRNNKYETREWYIADIIAGKAIDWHDQVPRWFVIGPPGSGKSTWVQHVQRQIAKHAITLNGKKIIPVAICIRAWEHWARKHNNSLGAFLACQYADGLGLEPQAAKRIWEQWLVAGVFLLLDGLDELPADSNFWEEAFEPNLTQFSTCPAVITCRTVNFNTYQGLQSKWPVFTLGGLVGVNGSTQKRDDYIRQYPAQHVQYYQPQELIKQINISPAIRVLASNPFFLSLLCYQMDSPSNTEFPRKATEFYNQAISRLLKRIGPQPERVQALSVWQKKAVLGEAALKLFQSRNRWTFAERDLIRALRFGLHQQGFPEPAGLDKRLLDEFTGKAALIRGSEAGGYFFLHLTIQEYLIASTLIDQIRSDIGEYQETITSKAPQALLLLQQHLGKAQWHQIILFFLEQLASEIDDAHILYLVLRMLYPVAHLYETAQEHLLEAISRLKEQDTHLFVKLLEEICQEQANDQLLYRQLFLAAKIIGRTNFREFHGIPQLVSRLRSLLKENYFQTPVCRAYEQLQAREHVDDLVFLFQYPDFSCHAAACEVVAKLGRPEHRHYLWPVLPKITLHCESALALIAKLGDKSDLPKLLNLLENANEILIYQEVLKTFCQLADASDLPTFLPLLKHHGQTGLYSPATVFHDIFIKIGYAEQIPMIMEFNPSSPAVQETLCQIIGHFTARQFMPYLFKCCQSIYEKVRQAGCDALLKLLEGELKLLEGDMLTDLTFFREHCDPYFRMRFCHLVTKYGQTQDLALLEPLRHKEKDIVVLSAFVNAIAKLGTCEHIEWLIDLTKQHDINSGPLEGGCVYGADAACINISKRLGLDLQTIQSLIQAESAYTREFYCNVISKLGHRREHADILVSLLKDQSAKVVSAACWALVHLEAREKLDEILKLLQHPNAAIRIIACRAISILGSRENIRDLEFLLQDESWHVRMELCNAIRTLGTSADLAILAPLLQGNRVSDGSVTFHSSESRAWSAYRELATAENLPEILPFLQDDQNCRWACHVITKIGDRQALPALIEALFHENREANLASIWGAISALGLPQDIPKIEPLLKASAWQLRKYGCWLIRDLGAKAPDPRKYTDLLIPLLQDNEQQVRYIAFDTIDYLTKQLH